MRMRTVEISVGGFILAGMLALAVLALKVSGLSLENSKQTYTITAMFDNTGALKPRARVALAGVIIGRVTRVELDKQTYTARVEMEIDSHIDNIPIDSTASIVTAGLLGEKYIGISIGGDTNYIQDGGHFEDTQSAVILEELISKFLLDSVEEGS